jgi:hypothetical protein
MIKFFVLAIVILVGNGPQEVLHEEVATQEECVAKATAVVEDAVNGNGKTHSEFEMYAVCEVKKIDARPA